MKNIIMKNLGCSDSFVVQAASYDGLYVGRVFSQYNGLYKVVGENGEVMAEVSGKFRFAAKGQSGFPAVGDFVMLDRKDNDGGHAIIHHMLPRKSVFVRKAAGTSNDEQVVASNIDTVFLCMSLNNDFNLRRLERYLAIAWDSGAMPVVVLTKADLCEAVGERLDEAGSVASGADIIVTSAMREDVRAQLMEYIKEGQTVTFIGSSGVGKSTLVNCLLGKEQQETHGLRNDDKGRHTTTRRELILLPDGGMVIDTPGMRELGLENADIAKTFAEIDELASTCKFSDCTHGGEPGCKVQEAISDGFIEAERLLSYQKLKKEARYEGLNAKQIETVKLNEMFSSVGGMKNARKFGKEKNKRR